MQILRFVSKKRENIQKEDDNKFQAWLCIKCGEIFVCTRMHQKNTFSRKSKAWAWGLVWKDTKGFLISIKFWDASRHFLFNHFYIVDLHWAFSQPSHQLCNLAFLFCILMLLLWVHCAAYQCIAMQQHWCVGGRLALAAAALGGGSLHSPTGLNAAAAVFHWCPAC